MCPRAMGEMSKQGLYFWLRSVVESGRCPGVSWIDEVSGVFQIPWSNQKSRSWQKEDSSVFLEYAKHTCKYKTGDKMDFPKWKQNLKSAINKNRYIERLRGRDHLSGPKPYRVYRFLNEKAEGKKSSSDIADVKNETADVLIPARLLPMENTGRIFNSSEAFLTQNDVSASGTFVIYTDGGTRSSVSSPFSAASLSGGFPLFPDIPRGDSCDYSQGNIPTIVSAYCETPDLLSGDESSQSLLPESTVIEASQSGCLSMLSTSLLGCQEITQHKDSFEENPVKILTPFLASEETKNQLQQQALQMLVTDQEQIQSPVLSNLIVNDSYGMLKINSVSQNSVCAGFRQDTNQATGADAVQISFDTVALQKSLLNSKRDHILNLNHPVNLVPPVDDSHKAASQTYISQKSLQTQQTRQEIDSGIKTCGLVEMPTSIPELSSYSNCNSSPSSSMDTYDINHLSGSQTFQGSQFTTYRNDHKSEATLKSIPVSPTVKTGTDDSVMQVQVLYGTPHRTVQKITITSKQSSCRLFYGAVKCLTMQREIRGHQVAEEVELPSLDSSDQEYHDEDKKEAIRKILKDMELGIVISYSNDDIFVERRCLPRVYLSDGVSKSESLPRSTKKRPDVRTLAFDYNKNFKESIEKHKTNNGAVPKDHFLLTIGYQIIPNDDSPTRMVPVYVVVRHVKAAMERFNILGASTIAPNPMCSDPTSFDKDVQLFKELDLK